ncbi:MAG TPA: dihydroxy-acid dehydratase [Pseudomonas sp.]|nr:dihydroxy-acid dehydratase [Pseudomonas sp.]
MLNPVIEHVTGELEQRSAGRRGRYLARLDEAARRAPRQALGCSNLAHVLAAQNDGARLMTRQRGAPHISSYNDLLCAHASLRDYLPRLKQALARPGATAQFAAGVPAMRDGITQGEAGMQLSLFSRDLNMTPETAAGGALAGWRSAAGGCARRCASGAIAAVTAGIAPAGSATCWFGGRFWPGAVCRTAAPGRSG